MTFAAAAHVVECTVRQHRYVCVPMEGRGIVAAWAPGRDELDIVCSCQSVHETRNFFARYLQIPEGSIRVTARDVGGGFGQKMFVFREECAIVLASRLLGRPVKWIEDRRENLVAAGHARNELGTVRLAIDADEVIQGITIEHVADVGAYPPCPAIIDPQLLPGPYKIPRLGFSMSMVWTNTMGKVAYRGPWMFETTAREMAIDHAARTLGIDPVELRRKNLLSSADLPFTSPGGKLFQEITPLETLEQALEILDYEAFRKDQAAARAEGRLLGLGISVYVEPTSMDAPTLATEGATVRVESSGKVVAYLGTTSHGQSVETTMAQIVADTLGVDYDDVTVVQADTQSTPYGPGTGGSRTAVVAGGAARDATLAVREKVLAVAAHSLEAAPEDLDIEAGAVFVVGTPARSVTMKEVAAAAYRFADAAAAGAVRRTGGHRALPPHPVPHVVERHPPVRGRDRPGHVRAAHRALHRLRGLRPDDQPDGRRGADLRRRRPGHRWRAPRGLRLRRRRQPADDDVHGLPPPDDDRGAGDRDRAHRDALVDEPGRVQGHGRGRGDRRPRGRGQRRRRRARRHSASTSSPRPSGRTTSTA